MSIFLFPNNPMFYCYFILPTEPISETQKLHIPELETFSNPSVQSLGSNPEENEKISLTR